jgi:hypothetical protein
LEGATDDPLTGEREEAIGEQGKYALMLRNFVEDP